MTHTEKDDSQDLGKLEEPGIDLTSFHEKRAGRLVIDPEFVAWRLLLVFQFYTFTSGKQGLSLAMP